MDPISFPPPLALLIGYSFSLILGGFLVDWIMAVLQNRSEVLKNQKVNVKRDRYLVRILGILERFLYTTCIIIGQPAGIAAWLAIKVLTRWTNDKEQWATISRSNLYLIGNLLNILFGAAGGLIILLLK